MGIKVIDSPSGGPRGQGRIEVLDETRVRVTITDKEQKTSVHELEFTQGVSLVKIGQWQLQSVSDVYIQLSHDKMDIQYIRPLNGLFYVKFERFGAEEGEQPTIRYDAGGRPFPGAKWENPARYKCYPLYRIINPGPYDGMELLDVLTYEFEWDENLEEFTIVGSDRRKWHEHFLAVLNVFGLDFQNDDLHYTGEQYDAGGPSTIPNVLPEIEDILQQRNRLAQVAVSDGWVDSKSIGPGPYGMTEESLRAAMAGGVQM